MFLSFAETSKKRNGRQLSDAEAGEESTERKTKKCEKSLFFLYLTDDGWGEQESKNKVIG